MQDKTGSVEELKEVGGIPKNPLRFFVFVSRKFKWAVLLSTFLVMAAATSDVLIRFLIEKIVDAIEVSSYEAITFWVLVYPLFFLATSIIWRLSGAIGRNWLLGIPKEATKILMVHATGHSHSYYSDRFAGSINSKISNVTNSMEEFVALFLWGYLESFVLLIVTGLAFLYTDVWAGVMYFGLILVAIILNIFLTPRKRRFSYALAEAQSKTSGFMVDVIGNMQAVRQFTSTKLELDTIEKNTEEVRSKGALSFLFSEYTMILNSLLFVAFSVFIFIWLIKQWGIGEVSSGRLITLILLITQTSGVFIFLGRLMSNTAKLYGRAQEGLNEILVEHDIVDSDHSQSLAVTDGKIVWQEVNFDYGSSQVFDNFNLVIPGGQRVGLVGPSGAGKSTFVSLLLRQFDIKSGVISIDDQDIKQVTQDSLRANIGVVPQEPALFHRTIKENIAYGKGEATDEEVIVAAKKAQAHDFISALPLGYDTMVGERGVKLSGGQKQRIAIARAMLKNAPILVLDEATSALDSESEASIQKALHILMEGKTVIAIAHRLSTLREMDRIIVLENGVITEDGTHETLKTWGGTYQRLWEHQAGGFVGD